MGAKLGNKLGSKGTRPREDGHTIEQRQTRRETMGDNGRQGRTKETRRKTMRDKLGAKGDKMADKLRDRATRPREGGHTIQQRETRKETMGDKLGDKLGDKGDKALGRRAHHPTKGNRNGDKLGDKFQTLGDKGDKASGRQTHHPTKGNKKEEKLGEKRGDKLGDKAGRQAGRQTGTQAGRQGETRPREDGHTIQQRNTCRETMGDKEAKLWEGTPSNKGKQTARQTSGMRTHHPTNGNKKGDNGRQEETRMSGRRTHHPTKGNKNRDMLGEKGRQDPS